MTYDADTQGGSSGCPVALNGTFVAVAIHDGALRRTDGTCGKLSACNVGTSFSNQSLLNAMDQLNTIAGTTPVYVDAGTPAWVGQPDGTVLRPYRSVADASTELTGNRVVTITAGNYEGHGITIAPVKRSITLKAVAGDVVLGPMPRPGP